MMVPQSWYKVEKLMHQGQFRLDIRKGFITERVVGHWNRVSRDIVMEPNLLEFKKLLGCARGPIV